MMRLSYRLYLLATALNYRLPRRLTKAGLLAALGLILAGAIGSDIDQSVAFEAFAFVFCLLIVAIGWIPFFRGRFTIIRALPRLASVDQPFRYRVEVRNGASRAYHDLELLEELADPRPTFAEFSRVMRPTEQMKAFRLHRGARPRLDFRHATVRPVELPPLPARGTVDTQLEVTPLRRGPLHFRGLTVARRDPLGLVRSFVRIGLNQTVLILPKRHRVPSLAFPGIRHYQAGGVALVDISDPAHPALLSTLNTPAAAQGVDFDPATRLAAIAMGTAGLQVADFSSSSAPRLRGALPGGHVRRVTVRLPAALLADTQRSFAAADLNSPDSPSLSSSLVSNLGGAPVDIAVLGNVAITADASFGRVVPIVGSPGFSTGIAMDLSYSYL